MTPFQKAQLAEAMRMRRGAQWLAQCAEAYRAVEPSDDAQAGVELAWSLVDANAAALAMVMDAVADVPAPGAIPLRSPSRSSAHTDGEDGPASGETEPG